MSTPLTETLKHLIAEYEQAHDNASGDSPRTDLVNVQFVEALAAIVEKAQYCILLAKELTQEMASDPEFRDMVTLLRDKAS
jgi:hypothetical protein